MKDYGGVCERYSDSHYEQMMRSLDPVETIGGFGVIREIDWKTSRHEAALELQRAAR